MSEKYKVIDSLDTREVKRFGELTGKKIHLIMKWKYCEPLNDSKKIDKVEEIFGIKFPLDFSNILMDNNAGHPEKSLFDTNKSKERIFGSLLDFNLDNYNNILKVYLRIKDILPNDVFPFGSDPGGNYLCFDYRNNLIEPEIIFWKHEGELIDGNEIYQTEYISINFKNFLMNLYTDDMIA